MTKEIDTKSPWVKATLALRLLIEIGLFVGIVLAAILSFDGLMAWGLAIAGIGTAATLWGVFAVPNDPSRSGKTVVRTPGAIRLALELTLFISVVAWLTIGENYAAASILGVATAIHYASWPARIAWLLKH